MDKDEKIVMLLGDVGFSFLEPMMKKFPDRIINCGIMEQSMMGISVGLSNMGFQVYVYTMRNFIAFRPYEQVRNDIAFGNANVKLFGVSGSAAYKFLGMSHNVFVNKNGTDEDVAMLQELPNMKVYQEEEEDTLKLRIQEEHKRNGPCYFII